MSVINVEECFAYGKMLHLRKLTEENEEFEPRKARNTRKKIFI